MLPRNIYGFKDKTAMIDNLKEIESFYLSRFGSEEEVVLDDDYIDDFHFGYDEEAVQKCLDEFEKHEEEYMYFLFSKELDEEGMDLPEVSFGLEEVNDILKENANAFG